MSSTLPTPVKHQAYRPDIDGLRALAVIPVVLFHIGFPGFFGGFIGVDVFFVISGYLITGIIARELHDGNFSIIRFYRRRVLRIFPALFVMLAVVSLLAFQTMLPSELMRFGKSLATTTLFSSNMLFFSESGYFAPDAHSKALLHTWSLAVEEQFYLFWPIILAALHARAFSSVRWISATITVASFIFSIWLLQINPSAAFYLIPARAWELMVGALIAVLPALPQRRYLLRELLAALGVVAILVGVKFYNEGVPFPGFAALLPCLGAAAIIAAGSAGISFVGKILSWRPIVFIGKISFSLYLWHWPVIVFAQIGLLKEQTWNVRIAELALSFILAALSWRFVEQPFRSMNAVHTDRRILVMATLVILVGFGCGLTYSVSGWPERYSEQQLALAQYENYDGDSLYRGGSCFVVGVGQQYDAAKCLVRKPGASSILIVGDSHAAHLWPGLHDKAGNIDILQATRTGCRPLPSGAGPGKTACQQFFNQILKQWLPQNPVDVVVLAGRWTKADLADLPVAIAAARKGAKKVVVVGPIPQYASALPRYLVRVAGGGDFAISAKGLVNAPFELDPLMRAVVMGAGANYFSLTDSLCVGRNCRVFVNGDVPVQFDYGHLTRQGSDFVAELLLRSLNATNAATGDLMTGLPLRTGH